MRIDRFATVVLIAACADTTDAGSWVMQPLPLRDLYATKIDVLVDADKTSDESC